MQAGIHVTINGDTYLPRPAYTPTPPSFQASSPPPRPSLTASDRHVPGDVSLRPAAVHVHEVADRRDGCFSLKVKLHYAYKVRNIGRVRPRLRFCVLCWCGSTRVFPIS